MASGMLGGEQCTPTPSSVHLPSYTSSSENSMGTQAAFTHRAMQDLGEARVVY